MGNSNKSGEKSKSAATTSSLLKVISVGTSISQQLDAPPAIVKGYCPSCQHNIYDTNEIVQVEGIYYCNQECYDMRDVVVKGLCCTKPIKESGKMVFIIIRNVSNIMTMNLIIHVLYALNTWTGPMVFSG